HFPYDIAVAGNGRGRFPPHAEHGRVLDKFHVGRLRRAAVIEADRDLVAEAVDAIVRGLVADLRPRDEVPLLAVEIDLRLQPVTPAVRQHEHRGVVLIAFAPLGVEDVVSLDLALAVHRPGRDTGAILLLPLNRSIGPRLWARD